MSRACEFLPAGSQPDSAYRARLNEIEAEQDAAREQKDWRRLANLQADWNFVFRQWLGRS